MLEKAEGKQDDTQSSTERVNFFTILRNRNFRNLWLGQIISQMGDYFAFLAIMVVVGSFSQDVGETTQQVSGVMIATALPRLLFGVLAGVFVDRWDRRLTMIAADLIRPALTLAMIPAFVSKNLLLMYVLAFVLSAVGTFFNPAKGALIPKMVPTEHLTSANALSQTSMTMAFVLGPALAGATFFLLGSGNEWIAFVLDAGSYLVSAIAISMIRMPKEDTQPSVSETPTEGSALGRVGQELLVGIKALAFNRIIATLSVVFAVTMLGIGALNVLWVSFLKSQYDITDSAELGWRFAVIDVAFFAGMVIASLAVGNILSNRPPKDFIVWGLIIAGAVTLPIGYLPDFWLIVVAMFVVGVAVAPINTGVMTLMQIVVPNHQLGRVGGG
ncbi:MAG: MFS transporter, partial [Chloroflexia bacterium]